jgi:hypothetical protein
MDETLGGSEVSSFALCARECQLAFQNRNHPLFMSHDYVRPTVLADIKALRRVVFRCLRIEWIKACPDPT